MAKSFLDLVRKAHPGDVYPGDEHGGGAGYDGSGLPTNEPGNFMFATGVECSYPTIQHGKLRRDLMEECGHYDRWKEDLNLVRALGLRVLRYGLAYYRTHLGPGKYDWSFADEVLEEMQKLEITPILDLLHFGVPEWLGNFQNPEFPLHFAEYAEAVIQRYPWVRFFTPVNEIYVTARVSALDGLWNEQKRDHKSFVTAIKHLTAANILATHRIAKHKPNAVIVQSESAEYWHEARVEQSEEIRLANKLRFISLDLLYGTSPDADIFVFLSDNGLTREEYDWFMAGEPPGFQILGSDYYGRNERLIKPDGTVSQAEDVMGWYLLTKEYFERYRRPVMYTETNVFDADEAPTWLWKQWINVLRMRRDGVPVLGFTWYSLTDQVDWHLEIAEKRGEVNACGLFDLDRKPRPLAEAYRSLLEEFGQITILPHGEMFDLTKRPARLKVEV